MDPAVLLALMLIEVHSLDGRTVYVNPEQIVSVAPPKDQGVFVEGVHCVITLSDRRFVSTKEDCMVITAQLRRDM